MNDSPEQPAAWRWHWKALISGLAVLHLFAVFIAPFHFATATLNNRNEPSPLADVAMKWMRPYVDRMYLQHGYFFFAPEPGPSHLMRFEGQGGDGQPLVFPHRKHQWPRLLYHRHFMLSETLNSTAPPLDLEMSIRRSDPDNPNLKIYDRLVEAFQAHVESTFGVEKAKLFRVRHLIPTPDEYEQLRGLTDQRLYVDLTPFDVPPPVAGGDRENTNR